MRCEITSGNTVSTTGSPPEMLVSVIVPIFNIENYLDDCVDSIVSSMYENLEILLIDDGSTDSSGLLCETWAAKDDRVRVIHQINRGPSCARNAGLDAATGSIIIFVDGDDYIEPRLVQTCVKEMMDYSADVVIYENDIVDERGRYVRLPQRRSRPRNAETTTSRSALELMFHDRLPHFAWKYAFSRDVLYGENIRFPPGRALEDVGTMYRVLYGATTVRRIPDILYHYRQRGSSILHSSPSLSLWNDWLANFDEIECYFESRDRRLLSLVRLWSLGIGINHLFAMRGNVAEDDWKSEFEEIALWVRERMSVPSLLRLSIRHKVKMLAIWGSMK